MAIKKLPKGQQMDKKRRDWIGITGQWLGVGLFLVIIFRYLEIRTPAQYVLPLLAGWIFTIATKIRGK